MRHREGSLCRVASRRRAAAFRVLVESTGVWRELCRERERGAVLGGEAAVSSSSREAPASCPALQVAPGSLQARQVLASSAAFLEVTASSALICSPVAVCFQGLGSLPSGAQLPPGGQSSLETPIKEPRG